MANDPMAPTTLPTYPNEIPPEQVENLISSASSLQMQVMRRFARSVLEEMRYHLWIAQEKCKIFEKNASRYCFLREKFHGANHPLGDALGMSEVILGDDLDSAIDREIAKQRSGSGI